MATKTVCLAVVFLAAAYAAPPQEKAVDIEDSDVGYFFRNTRIVGGEIAPDGAAPFMTAMSTGTLVRSLTCGGSVISERHILTAAHCIVAVRSCGIITGCSLTNSLRVHVGSNRWNSGDTRYSLSHDYTHPDYDGNAIKYDIGLLITDSPIVFTDRVQNIPLSFDHIGADQECSASGWGRQSAGGSLPADLKWADLITLDGQECEERVRTFAVANNVNAPPVNSAIEICTFHSVGQGTCNGDSGSPLRLKETGEQIGVVSWGFPCAIGAPDMFVRVSGFKDFLEEGLDAPL